MARRHKVNYDTAFFKISSAKEMQKKCCFLRQMVLQVVHFRKTVFETCGFRNFGAGTFGGTFA